MLESRQIYYFRYPVDVLYDIGRVDTVRHRFSSYLVRMTGLVSYSTKKKFQIFVHQFSRYRGFSDKNRTFQFFFQKSLIICSVTRCDEINYYITWYLGILATHLK